MSTRDKTGEKMEERKKEKIGHMMKVNQMIG